LINLQMSDAIHCAVRIRPRLGTDFTPHIWEVNKNVISKGAESYTFETVYDAMTLTEDIYNNNIKDLVDGTLEGISSSIMAYGQSGSGKTHTLTGSRFEDGVVQMAIKRVFQKIEESNRTFALRMSICEVYNEKIFDLIGNGVDLSIMESVNGIHIDGLTEMPLTDLASVESIVDASIARRSTGETARNERSSRSHVLYMVQIESRSKTSNRSLSSSLCIVDLAGSENVLLSQGSRITEGKFINKSLLALCKIITQLSEKQSHIGYRESKLTRLLKTSLSGNSRILIIATIDAGANLETASTLKFAKCAVKVAVTPRVNENVEEEGILASYMRQIEDLKEQLKDKEEADKNEEEKKKRLEELMRLILVGGEQKKLPFQNKKTRRMTWAPGKGASACLFSPLAVASRRREEKEEETIEEELDIPNLQTIEREEQRLSFESVSIGMTNETWRVNHSGVQTDDVIMNHIGVNTENEEKKEKGQSKEDKEIIEEQGEEKKNSTEKNLEDRLRREIVRDVQSKVEDKLKGMMDEISQLKRENRLKDERIDCLVRAEQSMLVGPSLEMEERDRADEEMEDLKLQMKDKEDQVRERDAYIEMMKKKEDDMRKRIIELEKRCSDQMLTIRERTTQVNRHRNEKNEIMMKKDKEMEHLGENHRLELHRMSVEMAELNTKMESKEKDMIRKEEALKKAEKDTDELRMKYVCLTNELSIEKERQKRNGVTSQSQTQLTAYGIEEKEAQLESVKKEFDNYKAMMSKREAEGIEKAQSNVKYWQERARKAEASISKKPPLARIDNRGTH
ncbi:hypothetical protein PMAYCL1PPCAC_18259, partial [Pristionchus mayeri]